MLYNRPCHYVLRPRRSHVFAHKGGSKNSLKELEKKATATPKIATLLTTLAFSGDVKAPYALAT